MNSQSNPTPTAEEAVNEIAKLAALMRERGAIRAAREAELNELMGRSGGADALDRLDAINADVVRLSTALNIEARALDGARKRIAELTPVVVADVARLSVEIEGGQRTAADTVRAAVSAILAPHFARDTLPGVVGRSVAFMAEINWQAAHRFGNGGLSFQFGPGGDIILADDVGPQQLVSAWRRGSEIASAVAEHLVEVRKRHA